LLGRSKDEFTLKVKTLNPKIIFSLLQLRYYDNRKLNHQLYKLKLFFIKVLRL